MTNIQATAADVLILLGPPGAGKGSQATLIKDWVEIAHISTGDLLRGNIKLGTDLGAKAKKYMDEGQLVPDELVFEMLFTRVEQPDCKKGYILDGFPRNLAQAKALQKRLEGHQITAINLSVPDQELIERITKRQICEGCQTPYHLVYSPPKEAEICDRCGAKLFQRSDDTKEVVEQRLKVYHDQTAPLIDFYEKKGVLQTIVSNSTKEAVFAQVLAVLEAQKGVVQN